MTAKVLPNILKGIIWFCLGIIIFSPLYLSANLFFPYIVTKTIAFNLAVEVMLVTFVLLTCVSREYQIKINTAVALLAIYLVLITISSLLGDWFYRSFWSNNERSEGILLLLHLFAFLLVLVGFFRRFQDWLYIFNLALTASFLVALIAFSEFLSLNFVAYQNFAAGLAAALNNLFSVNYFNVLAVSSGGQRLAGTIGNAGYMAGYLIFAIFFGLFLFLKRKNFYWRLVYLIVVALEVFVVLHTFTRGGILALWLAGPLLLIFLSIFYWRSIYFRIIGLVAAILILLLPLIIFLNQDAGFVKNNDLLFRVASISLNSTTAQNRLVTWGSAWRGFQERPLFGWGYENFYQAFDRYFNPKIHDTVWYDRAHNIIFDRLVTGGILGLISYLLLLFLPLFYLLKHYSHQEGGGRKYFMPVIFTLVMLAYFIQNFFIFEALVTYVPLFLVLAFISLFGWQKDYKFLNQPNFKIVTLIAVIILFIPAVYLASIKPLAANAKLTRAISDPGLSVNERQLLFEEILAASTSGNQEYRRQFVNFLETLVASGYSDAALIASLTQQAKEQVDWQLAENPHSVVNYLLAMRFYDLLFQLSGDTKFLDQSIAWFDPALELSPTRQQVYYELDYAHRLYFHYWVSRREISRAQQHFNSLLTNAAKEITLDPDDFEAYRHVASTLALLNNKTAIQKFIDGQNLPAKFITRFWEEIAASAMKIKNWNLAKEIWIDLAAADAVSANYYAQLAVTYAALGQNDLALRAADKLNSFGGEFSQQARQLIDQIQAGGLQDTP